MCACVTLEAQVHAVDTTRVASADTVVTNLVTDTVVVLHPADTVVVNMDDYKRQSTGTANSDNLLLQLIAQQSQDIHVRDSLLRDSLLADLMVRETVLQTELTRVRDSITLLRADELARMAYEDSLEHARQEMDSITRLLSQASTYQGVEAQRSLVKDPTEDLADRLREWKNRFNPWTKEANVLLQFSQNYISPNWYKGGSSSFAILSLLKGKINYHKDKFVWENTGEWRTGVATSPGDTLRKYNVSEDLVRIYSKFGYQVMPKLYVSANAEFNTTLWNVWNTNQTTAKTAFFTPMKLNVGAGIDYKPIKNMSIVISPLTYRMTYAYYGDESGRVDVTTFDIEAGKHIKNEVGSSLQLNWKWKPLREIAIETEFYFYTNYHRVEIDWEVDCDFIINRFLTTRLMLHPRFDSAYIQSGDTRAKVQFKELLSIGFAHKFK